ncbi:biotin--[acetyl-CoA-carboxylase] ligase [Thermococcus aggregans]|uniref:Biotin--[acetyl-CoA-carboxylase] ligase n=1 Tax=Thermococcus aggregans TaxID=110163 RepID=A0A9E7MW75_THEAG|nr:biotin--[acetyl-CoA-carboxylase] ligase [Thermococcus aggregans]USS40038.1 biotin--[acetyl-CoA-carboxylase] ligase [Thermococcus aggregans]
MLGLNTKSIGRKVIYFQEIESTNEYAKKIAPHEDEGTIITADVQKRGYGRKFRTWMSPKGGLWMSVILKPKTTPEHIVKIVFLGAIAVVETLERFGVEAAKIKWPNDVLVNEKKICGILAEGSFSEREVYYVILGIGINVNNPIPEELLSTSTSISKVLGVEIPIEDVFKILVERLEYWYKEFLHGKDEKILQKWKEKAILNREVRVIREEGEIRGKAVDIDELGALILELEDGRKEKVLYGDVSLRFE